MNVRFLLASALYACAPRTASVPLCSSTLALSADDRQLWVVSPDADSISLIDLATRTLVDEILLADAPPQQDSATKRYEPRVKPRALAIAPDNRHIYVAGQMANAVFVIDVAERRLVTSIPVAAEPTGIVATDGAVYVVSHQAGLVSKIDPERNQVTATVQVGEHPWGIALSADKQTLYVSQFLLHPGVTLISTAPFAVQRVVELAEEMATPSQGKLVPNGVARGVYAAVPRPVGGDVWLPHLLLAIHTAQPDLDFESTAFPTLSTFSFSGEEKKRLLFQPLQVANAIGSFSDVISGPRALAFTPDGKLALLANSGSEDVMVFDGESGKERALVRPLDATFLEGIAVDHHGKYAYVDGRSSHNIVVLRIHPEDTVAPVVVDGAPIDRLRSDPMPEQLRQGQRLFYSANSAAFPITKNFWLSCSSCHLEGASDAVTWLFSVGPRDTPSNAGGPINSGFLLRQALRHSVVEYDLTINIEQGGNFHRDSVAQQPMLEALTAFVNLAIPFAQNPFHKSGDALSDAASHGQILFAARCASCHPGAYFTDSGANNPTLDFNGPIVLHDIGTCVTDGSHPDKAAPDDVLGHPHTACDFDTPSLRSIFATAPYFHDGSAATLRDVVDRLPTAHDLGPSDRIDLVEYLQTL